ncbi:MAG: hypothetical protein R3E31_11600 [Chloroflexota bacterium]
MPPGLCWGQRPGSCGQITITQPDTPPEFTPQYPLTAALPDLGLTLLGYNQDRDAAAPANRCC